MYNLQINGDLEDEENLNFDLFYNVIVKVFNLFIITFGNSAMSEIKLYIDNSTQGSGHTPIITPIFNEYLIIKLNITSESHPDQIAFQFSHELCHYLFFSKIGFSKGHAKPPEEAICSAMSLCVIKSLYPDSIFYWKSYVRDKSSTDIYKEGYKIAEEIDYNVNLLKEKIEKYVLEFTN